MDWITGIQNAINYIEEHLTEEIDYEEVAKEAEEVNVEKEPITEPQPARQETIVNTIPSRINSQDTYTDYENIFASIRRKTKQ